MHTTINNSLITQSEFYDTAATLHEITIIAVSPTEYTNSKFQFKSVLLLATLYMGYWLEIIYY